MDEVSARWSLPLIVAGQAQKEMTHNEAVALIDLILQPAVEAVGLNNPPATPAIGACWVIGAAPTGAWEGQAHAVAGWTAGGWRFVAPRDGFCVWDAADNRPIRFHADAWSGEALAGESLRLGGQSILSSRAAAISAPRGGTQIDAEAREALSAILLVLQHHRLID